MSTCPLQVRLWLTGPSCWLDVYLADITSRVLERVSCHAGGRVVTTNVTNKRDIDLCFHHQHESPSLFCLLDNISDSFHNLLHCRGSPHKLTPKVRCEVMSRSGNDSPAGGAGGHLRPGVTCLADQVTAGALPDPRDLRLLPFITGTT